MRKRSGTWLRRMTKPLEIVCSTRHGRSGFGGAEPPSRTARSRMRRRAIKELPGLRSYLRVGEREGREQVPEELVADAVSILDGFIGMCHLTACPNLFFVGDDLR